MVQRIGAQYGQCCNAVDGVDLLEVAMLREHFPYAVVALLFGSLGANDISVFAVVFLMIMLWIPLVNMLDAKAEHDRRVQEELRRAAALEEGDPEPVTEIGKMHDD